ncbi:MAG: DUF58 domain-containing protein, partial [Pirellulales bacterium]
EDTNLRCTMVVDVSHSMQYGNGPLNKFEYAATIAASLSYLVLQQQDAVGCITFDDRIRMRIPIRSKRNHIHSVIDSLDTQSPSDKTDMYAVMREIAETVPRRGMIMLISDLLGDIEGTIKGLKLLRQRGHDVLVFHVLDDDELDFEFNGAMRFDGLESDDFLNCNPRALREGYLTALNEFLTDIRRQCASNAVDYALIRTSDPLDAVLAKYLSRRLGHQRS